MLFDLPLNQLQTYLPPREEPVDFDAFWADTLVGAQEFPLDATFTPLDAGLRLIESFDVTFRGYGGQPKDVVLCACSNKQLYEIEHAVQAIDPGCFIIMLQSNEVHGEGFRQLELGKNENKSE